MKCVLMGKVKFAMKRARSIQSTSSYSKEITTQRSKNEQDSSITELTFLEGRGDRNGQPNVLLTVEI